MDALLVICNTVGFLSALGCLLYRLYQRGWRNGYEAALIECLEECERVQAEFLQREGITTIPRESMN